MNRLIIVFIVLGVLGVIIYDITSNKTTNKTSGQVYKNQENRFEFSYPKDWQINTIGETVDPLNLDVQKKEDKNQYDIYISVSPNLKKLTALDLFLDNFVDSAREEAKKGIKQVKFGGLSGIEYQEGLAPANYSATAVFLTKGDKAYKFIYTPTADGSTANKYLNEFYLILQNLKFY